MPFKTEKDAGYFFFSFCFLDYEDSVFGQCDDSSNGKVYKLKKKNHTLVTTENYLFLQR